MDPLHLLKRMLGPPPSVAVEMGGVWTCRATPPPGFEYEPSRADEPDTDWVIARRARAGNPEAVSRLCERLACVPSMVRMRDKRLGTNLCQEDLQEVSQESLLALWSKLDRYDGSRPLEAWAYGFVVRQHLKAVEGRRRRATAPLPSANVLAEPVADSIHEEDRRLVVESLNGLDGRTRDIMRRRHYDDRTFDQIAAELDTSSNTIKTRYYRGLARLRIRLRQLWGERRP